MSKVSGVLNINMIQNFIGSLIGILGNVLVGIFSITFITFFFLKDHRLFFESILMWVPDKYVDNVTRALYSIKTSYKVFHWNCDTKHLHNDTYYNWNDNCRY